VATPDSELESEAESEADAESDDAGTSDCAVDAADVDESVGVACDDENGGPLEPSVVGESLGLAVALVVHDDETLLDTAGDEGCADVDEGCAEVGEELGGADEVGADEVGEDEVGEDDFEGRCVGRLPNGGPGSTGGTRLVIFGGVGGFGPTGTIRPTPAA
jgi:hypothetical protein